MAYLHQPIKLKIFATGVAVDVDSLVVIDSSHSTDSYFPLEYRSAILMVKNQ